MPLPNSNLENFCAGKRTHIAAFEITRDDSVAVAFSMGSWDVCILLAGIGIGIGIAVGLEEKSGRRHLAMIGLMWTRNSASAATPCMNQRSIPVAIAIQIPIPIPSERGVFVDGIPNRRDRGPFELFVLPWLGLPCSGRKRPQAGQNGKTR